MTSKLCDICKEMNLDHSWVFRLSDDKERIEFNGHSECIDSIYNQFKSIKDYSKKSVKQVLKELKLKE